MRIYTFLAEAQRSMYENYFLSSLPKDCEPHPTIHTEPYVDYGFNTAFAARMRSKISFMADTCRQNVGNIIIFADADVQFFGPIKKTVLEELGEFDIACQQGGVHTYFSLCPGFCVCRCNDTTLTLFNNMGKFFRADDQYSLNEQRWLCKHKCLSPFRFFTIGHVLLRNQLWEPGCDFNIPDQILVHHASGVTGLENKLKLMDVVRAKFYEKEVKRE